MTADRVDELLEQLRSEFDASFQRAASGAGSTRELLIAIRVGGERYALRPGELAGLARARSIVPLSAGVRGRLGLTSVQGTLVPVYALAELVGARSEPASWLAVCAGPSPVALGFAEVEGSIEGETSKLSDERSFGRHVSAALDDPAGRRLVVDVASIVTEIASACRASSREE